MKLKNLLSFRLDANGNHSISVIHSGRYHVSGHGAQRTTYRLLADMSDEDWGIPDICLQKTAEVILFTNKFY